MRRTVIPNLALVAALLLVGPGLLSAQAPESPAKRITAGVEEIASDYEAVTQEAREGRAALQRLPVVAPEAEYVAEYEADRMPPHPEAEIEVEIEGPTEASGGFALVGIGPEGAVLRWRVEKPDGAADPLRMRDEAGSPVLVFLSPAGGRYVVTLTAQVPSDGLDPFGEATHVVRVGGPGPKPPTPPDPPVPPPGPDLTGLAKVVYQAAQGVDKAALKQAAGAYGSQVSAIGAGAYNAVPVDAAKGQIVAAIQAQNPPRNVAPALFDAIDGELQKREEAGQFSTLAAVAAALTEIETGLEAAAR